MCLAGPLRRSLPLRGIDVSNSTLMGETKMSTLEKCELANANIPENAIMWLARATCDEQRNEMDMLATFESRTAEEGENAEALLEAYTIWNNTL
jgi:hypothetical protein